MSSIKEYKIVSMEFRRLSGNVLRTDYTDGNFHLIRLKKYIEDQKIIKEIIERKISGVEYDYNNFVVKEDGRGYLNPPIDEAEHIKGIYDYLDCLTQKNLDLRGIARNYIHTGDKWNDIIREFLDKVFKPFIDFIVDSLSKEIMLLENEVKANYIHQHIEKNYGAANIAQRDIDSTNIVSQAEVVDICDLVNNVRSLILKENIDEEQKEDIVDDLDVIEEQVNSDVPKVSRLKKAYNNIKKFFQTASITIASGTELSTSFQSLIEKIKDFIDTLPM